MEIRKVSVSSQLVEREWQDRHVCHLQRSVIFIANNTCTSSYYLKLKNEDKIQCACPQFVYPISRDMDEIIATQRLGL